MSDRRQESYAVRLEAAELARSRNHPEHKANGEEQKYAGDKYFMSFTKGLPHDCDTGLLSDPNDFVEFRRAIDDGFIDPFTDRVNHGAETVHPIPNNFRQWEAPTAGVVYELQGPDAQAVTMAPAPPLIGADGQVNQELVLEMAEVYELAVLRDKPFNAFEDSVGDVEINASIDRLNALPYICNQTGRPRKVAPDGKLDLQTVFRGSSPGVEIGPHLSQFLLIGNTDLNGGGSVAEGLITYGVLRIDQRVPIAEPRTDYMTTMTEYVEVQNGIEPAANETYGATKGNPVDAHARPPHRFISTPRDLATYVHFDALYEAYLNACIILLGMKTPFDPGFDHLSGGGVAAGNASTRRHAGGFALYGGPHILNLVTEVSTRALKAVRFQKFNNHIRLRPEALAARIELLREPGKKNIPQALSRDIGLLKKVLAKNVVNGKSTLTVIEELTGNNNPSGEKNHFLPMAFNEGSPMHPAYGAGHATVAGACVTILKAFFDTSAVLAETPVIDKKTGFTIPEIDKKTGFTIDEHTGNPINANGQIIDRDTGVPIKPQPDKTKIKIKTEIQFKRYSSGDPTKKIPPDKPIAFRAPKLPGPGAGEGDPNKNLVPYTPNQFLTLEGELNKLAANISIGRNMAGVHYFSDYYDSVRMGEKIAIGILEEQALTYSTDPFVLSVPTFDGDVVRIGRR